MFRTLQDSISATFVKLILNVQKQENSTPQSPFSQRKDSIPLPDKKVGRNDPCPCGSNKKYKKCHGLNQ